MNSTQPLRLPVWFRVVAIAAIVWNGLGITAFFMDATMSETALAALPDTQRELYEQTPAWITGAYGIAVFAGLLGSIALALRKKPATAILGLSLAAVIVQMGYQFGIAGVADVLGASSLILPAVIIVIAAALVWFSKRSDNLGWLR